MDFEITEISGPNKEDMYTIRYRQSDGETGWMLTSSIEPRTPEQIVRNMLERNAAEDARIEYLRRPDVPIPSYFPSFKRWWCKETQMVDMTEEEAKKAYTENCEHLGYIVDENMVPHKPATAITPPPRSKSCTP